MSPVRALPAELGAVRALIADGSAEIVRAAGDLDQFWIRSACDRLAAADAVLAGVLNRRPAALSVLATTIGTAAVAAGSAALARVLGGGLLVALGIAALVLIPVWLRPRRSATPALPIASGPPGPGLTGVPLTLERARVRLVSASLRRAGRANWRAPALRRALGADPVLARLAEADLLLCQAIDCLDRYLDDLSKGWSP
ncbi:hypothetical protein [Actinoplanes sp. L3-i22]|uniref:hypothetical protein n=1 Tax=Actinoplanes sp. L3-i22 TaxID=2836373 RepID=UPI001C74BAD6|nr:hypothetical protein [Actinoplanes sp. L3-i22]BCY14232.1 hypothetical protein L3i22_093200 [Actinoplanes sp. L3-i22]